MKLLIATCFSLLFGVNFVCAQTSADHTNVLSTNWREKIKDLHHLYEGRKLIKPGIPSDASPELFTGDLPWKEKPMLIQPEELEEWSKSVQLTIKNEPFKGAELALVNVKDGYLELAGRYATDRAKIKYMNWMRFSITPHKSDSLCAVSYPLRELNNIYIKFTSRLTDRKGNVVAINPKLGFLYVSTEKDPSGKLYTKLGITLLPKDCEKLKRCRGSIDVEFLRPDTKHIMVPLGKANEGKKYEMDSIPFRLLAAAPGDVIIEYTGDKDPNWENLPYKNGHPMEVSMNGFKNMSDVKQHLLYYYTHPAINFGEYLLEMKGVNLQEMETTPEAIRRAACGDYAGTADEIRAFHEVVGKMVGYCFMTDILDGDDIKKPEQRVSDYELLKSWLRIGFGLIKETGKDYRKARSLFKARYKENSLEQYLMADEGMNIGYLRYLPTRLEPDWTIVDREAIKYIQQWKASFNPDEKLEELWEQQKKYLDPYVSMREPLPLTDVDIEYLSRPLPEQEKDANGKVLKACWAKTFMDADAVCFYRSLFNPDNETFRIFKVSVKLE